MTQIQKNALYHLLRLNSMKDPSLKVQPWQVEDYRKFSLEELFSRLSKLGIQLNRSSFATHADECDSPEELVEVLSKDEEVTSEEEDKIYLLSFELWRRVMADKPSLSIFCNELDHQIQLYDEGNDEYAQALQDAIENFFKILDENVDEGLEPAEALELVSAYCANDIRSFIYDYMQDLIDDNNESYAKDILEESRTYLKDDKWFKLLDARLSIKWPPEVVHEYLERIIEDHIEENDLIFNFDLLDLIITVGPHGLFYKVIAATAPLLKSEEDFQDLLSICLDYFLRIDQNVNEKSVQNILDKRSYIVLDAPINAQDKDIAALLAIVSK